MDLLEIELLDQLIVCIGKICLQIIYSLLYILYVKAGFDIK